MTRPQVGCQPEKIFGWGLQCCEGRKLLVGQLLLGGQLMGVAIPVARVAGAALIALGIACWPGPPLLGMLTYSVPVTLYLAYLGFAGGLTGVLLWPAIIFHLILTALLARDLMRMQRDLR